MSNFLYVVYTPPVTADFVESDLRPFVVDRCQGKVLNNALQGFRFKVTTEKQEVFVEPALFCKDFFAVLRQRKKRPMLVPFLQAMWDWAAQRNWKVQLL